MVRAMEYASSSGEIADLICASVINLIKKSSLQTQLDLKQVFAHLFLISDILFNTKNPYVPAAWSYRREFEPRLAQVYHQLNSLWTTKIEGLLS